MTTATLAPPKVGMTPEEFLLLPDEGRGYELVDGKLVELSMSAASSYVGAAFVALFKYWCRANHPAWVFQSDASFRCFPDTPEKIRRCDACVIALDRFSRNQFGGSGFISVCPDLVVEVTSPNDLASDVVEKRDEWLAAGAKLVWIVDPVTKTVLAHRADGSVSLYREKDLLPGDPVLPGLSVSVAELFALPGE